MVRILNVFLKKVIVSISAFFLCGIFCFATNQRSFLVEYKKNHRDMADVLHIILNTVPKEDENILVEQMLIQQLLKYGNMLSESEETKYKNIIGSVWYYNGNPSSLKKVKIQKYLSAYVWLGRTRTVVPFQKYIYFLKKWNHESRIKYPGYKQ